MASLQGGGSRRVAAKACATAVGVAALMGAALWAAAPAEAAEGGMSLYLPGTAGDFGLALMPSPGVQLGNVAWVQSGSVGRALLQGRANADLDVTVALDILAATWTTNATILGGRWSLGAAIPFGYAQLDATVTGPLGVPRRESVDSFDISDMAVTPLQLNWAAGSLFFKFAETIIVPTGAYDTSEFVNLGRNYWGFDTIGAVTWFDPAAGFELSAQAGVLYNLENPATNYRTGTELHADFTANWMATPTFLIGPRAYVYQQIEGDSGAGARFGDFESSSAGVGLGFLWTPAAAGGRLAIAGKWMHDLAAEKRFKSDYFQLTLGWSL